MPSPYQLLLRTRPGKKRAIFPFSASQDRAIIREFTAEETGRHEPAVLIVVADGVSRCPDGGAVAEWIVHEKLNTDPIFQHPTMDLGGQLRSRILEFHLEFLECFRDDHRMLGSGCTLAAALLYGSRGIVLWSGDSPAYHLQPKEGGGFSSQELIVADKDPYTGALTDCFSGLTSFSLRYQTMRLNQGDIVIVATDGIVFSGEGLADSIVDQGFSDSWMEGVCQHSFESPRSDDIAIVAARWIGPA